MNTNGLKDQAAPMTVWPEDRKEAGTMKMTEIIAAKVQEMDELNARGEKANGRSTISFEEALASWR